VVHGEGYHVPSAGRWTVLILGITFLGILIAVLSVFFANLVRGNRFKRQQRDFGNMITHELRLPLSSIQVFAQTLVQRPLELEERNRFAEGILSECSRLSLLIDQLLKFQQMEQGKLPVRKTSLDAGEFLNTFAGKWPRPLKVRVDESVRLEADPMLLELALANLVSNAEKYGRGGTPEIELSHPGSKAQFIVRDGGRPIPQKFVKRIFRKYYRMPNVTTRRQTGVGLGLYIVKNIASLHQGSIAVNPLVPPAAPAEGNEFILRLPAQS
jgi:signal transduction histidine kinase